MTSDDLAKRLRERADACFHAEGARPYTAEDAAWDLIIADELDRLATAAGAVSAGSGFREIKDKLPVAVATTQAHFGRIGPL